MIDGHGNLIGCVAAGANRHHSILLEPTWEHLARFDPGLGCGLPDHIAVHLDAGYDSAKTRERLAGLGCDWIISTNSEPLQAGHRWGVERTNAWHNRGFHKLLGCTERRTRVLEGIIALANAIFIVPKRLIRQVCSTHSWDNRSIRRP